MKGSVDVYAGNAGALARRGAGDSTYLPSDSFGGRVSRFALNAGEGARAPSKRLLAQFDSRLTATKCMRIFGESPALPV